MINKGLIATKGNLEMATLTPKEIAVKFDSDPRTVRKFLRSEGTRVGKGHRHAIDSKSLKSLQKRFDAWNAAKGSNDEKGDEGAMTEETARTLTNALLSL